MGPTHVALITTTINVPHALEFYVTDWGDRGELDLIVSGDVQTPKETQDYVEGLGGTYISVDSSLAKRWRTDKHVGLRSIQRRNIALLHAMTTGAKIIVTVDDDNTPSLHYFERILDEFNPDGKRRTFTATSGWFNPGGMLYPSTVARGFPIELRNPLEMSGVYAWQDASVGVVNGVTTGDPDIDAIERLVNWPKARSVAAEDNIVLARGTWAPFNTQNTAFTRDLAPLMQCLVGVGRYDDIIMSYIARVVMDHIGRAVSYGHPSTFSDRNDHDVLVDLEKEIYGYKLQRELIAILREVADELTEEVDTDVDVISLLDVVYERVSELLPPETVAANLAWIADVHTAMKEGEG